MTEESNSAAENTNDATAVGSGESTGATGAAAVTVQQTANPVGGESLFAKAEGDEVDEPSGSAEGQPPERTAESGEQGQQGQESQSGEPEGHPEQYEDFKVPEGYELGRGVSDSFKGVAKELGLTQTQAQSLVDAMTPALAKRQAEELQAVNDGFVNRTMSDPEIGGTKWQTAQRDVARIRDMFGKGADGKMDPDVAEFLNSPMGNHPGILKLFARAGRAFGEGGFPRGRADNGGQILASDIYPNTRINKR